MTAIAGKRMAETVARRGGLVVIPQDIPIPVVADVVAWVKSRHLVFDTPIELAPTQTVAEALALMPKRAHRAAVVVEDGRPLGVVTAEDCAEVDRFAQAKDVMRPADGDDRRGHRPAGGVRRARRGARAASRSASTTTAGWSACSPAPARCGRRSTTRRWTRAGGLRVAAAVGVNGDVADKAGRLLDAGVDCLVVDTAHGHQDRMVEALGRGPRARRPTVPGRGRQRRLRRGHPRPDRGRRRHRQGRRRAGRDVHDPDDDRRRPAAVLGRPRVRRRGRASSASTSGPTGECGTRATSRWRSPPAPRR